MRRPVLAANVREPFLYGVAVGCFADPDFPPPNFELHEKQRHAWVQDLDLADSYEEWAPPEKMAPNREPAA